METSGTTPANGHVISNNAEKPGNNQTQPHIKRDASRGYTDDEIKHETLAYNWDSPTDRSAPLGFRDLFLENWHPTLVYCAVFWSFGVCVAVLGPTLLDLGCQTSSDMKESSWVFFFQLCCTLIGSIFAGFLAPRANANYVILVSSSLIPLSMFIIPFCQVLATLGVVLCVMGINMGIVDCLTNLKMIQLFGEDVPPFLQAMHFSYGLGAFISPLIARPFLLDEDCSVFIDYSAATIAEKNLTLPAETLEKAQEMSGVRYAYWILCLMQIPVPFLMATLLYREKNFTWKLPDKEKTDQSSAVDNGAPTKSRKKPGVYGTIPKPNKSEEPFWQQEQYRHFYKYKCCGSSTAQILTITLATAIALGLFDGLQSAYGGYIYTFAKKNIDADFGKTDGAYLNALYWGMFAVGRLLSIPLATICSSAFMMLGNIAGCLTSIIVMLSMIHKDSALFAGTAFFGLFLSSATPTALALAEQYIDITSSITTFVVVVAAFGDMVAPVVVGNLMEAYGPVSFLQFLLITCVFSIITYLIVLLVGTQTPKYKAKGPTSFLWCRMCCMRPPDTMSDDGVTTHVKYYSRMSESDSNMELSNMNNGTPGH